MIRKRKLIGVSLGKSQMIRLRNWLGANTVKKGHSKRYFLMLKGKNQLSLWGLWKFIGAAISSKRLESDWVLDSWFPHVYQPRRILSR